MNVEETVKRWSRLGAGDVMQDECTVRKRCSRTAGHLKEWLCLATLWTLDHGGRHGVGSATALTPTSDLRCEGPRDVVLACGTERTEAARCVAVEARVGLNVDARSRNTPNDELL